MPSPTIHQLYTNPTPSGGRPRPALCRLPHRTCPPYARVLRIFYCRKMPQTLHSAPQPAVQQRIICEGLDRKTLHNPPPTPSFRLVLCRVPNSAVYPWCIVERTNHTPAESCKSAKYCRRCIVCRKKRPKKKRIYRAWIYASRGGKIMPGRGKSQREPL